MGSGHQLDATQTVHLIVQLVPAVTELLISELLWLNYSGPEKPVYMYVNSIGSQTADGQVRAPAMCVPMSLVLALLEVPDECAHKGCSPVC